MGKYSLVYCLYW